MLCTNCSKVVKPVVALDIDGTIGRYHEHFLKFAEAYLDKDEVWDYDSSQSFRSWFCSSYGVTEDVWHDVKLAYRQGGMKRSMPAYPGAKLLAEKIKEFGAELWITTTRPYIRHDNVDPDTREWLRRNGIVYDYLLYDGHKYEKLMNLVGSDRVAIIIDDLNEELQEAGKFVDCEYLFLRANAFNEYYVTKENEFKVVSSLNDAIYFVKNHIDSWRELHENKSK